MHQLIAAMRLWQLLVLHASILDEHFSLFFIFESFITEILSIEVQLVILLHTSSAASKREGIYQNKNLKREKKDVAKIRERLELWPQFVY